MSQQKKWLPEEHKKKRKCKFLLSLTLGDWPFEGRLVGGGGVTVDQSGFGENTGTSADGEGPGGSLGTGLDLLDQLFIVDVGAGTEAWRKREDKKNVKHLDRLTEHASTGSTEIILHLLYLRE